MSSGGGLAVAVSVSAALGVVALLIGAAVAERNRSMADDTPPTIDWRRPPPFVALADIEQHRSAWDRKVVQIRGWLACVEERICFITDRRWREGDKGGPLQAMAIAYKPEFARLAPSLQYKKVILAARFSNICFRDEPGELRTACVDFVPDLIPAENQPIRLDEGF